jgi:hypothetical protein
MRRLADGTIRSREESRGWDDSNAASGPSPREGFGGTALPGPGGCVTVAGDFPPGTCRFEYRLPGPARRRRRSGPGMTTDVELAGS